MIIIGKSGNPDHKFEGWVEGQLHETQTYGSSVEEVYGNMILSGIINDGDCVVIELLPSLQKASEYVP